MDRVKQFVKIPQCTCEKCECDVRAKVVKMIEEEQAHQFLMGLDEETYASVRSQVLALDPLPPLDRIFNMIQQEENHKQLMLERENRPENFVAFAVKAKSLGGEKNTCKHCGRYRHEGVSCYEIIGYPLTWGTWGSG